MHDSSMAPRQIQIEAIRQSISRGDLTAQQIHDILLAEIAAELSKPQEEVDIDYVNVCQDFLMELNSSRTAVLTSHYEKNLTAVRKKIQSRFSFGPRTILGRFAAVMCIIVLITVTGILLPEGWIITHQSEDEGQYIMQGIKTPEGFVSVAEAGPVTGRSGMYVTSDWSEVIQYMGGVPPVPQWLPSGWYISQYSVGLTSNVSSLTISYAHPNIPTILTYTYYAFFDSNLYMAVEQDEAGSYEVLKNGTNVYVTTNLGNRTATWYTDHAEYMISGELTREELLRVAEEIK